MTLLAIAHRAGNSLAGLHEANLLGADVIECDVHEYRGRLEVRHLKTAGPLPFLWDRWALVPAGAPRLGLAELLAADRRGATFMLDLKGRKESTGRAVADLVHASAPDHPILVCGRHWPAVDRVAAELGYVSPVLSARTRTELRALLRRLADPDTPTPYGASVHAALLDAGTVARLHRRLRLVMTWPVNDVGTLERVTATGVRGIISDEPDVLRTVLNRRLLPPGS
jgi:glycerophosphoryl diester phosphodiesterase